MGMLADIKRNFQTAVDRQDQEGQMYDRGEINPLQYGLRTAGNAVDATLGNVVGTATDYLIPDEVEQYVGEAIMDTAPAQYAMELAQRYPEQARDLSAGLSIAEAVPFVRGITTAAKAGRRVDASSQQVFMKDAQVTVTAYEYRLLSYLMLHTGKVISKRELVDHIYEEDDDRDSNTIEVFIRRLRKKLDPDETLKPIETQRGQGYRFSIPRD